MCPLGTVVVFQPILPLDLLWAFGPTLSLVLPSRNGLGGHLCMFVVINDGQGETVVLNGSCGGDGFFVKERKW